MFIQLLLISRHWSALHVSIIALSISSYFLVVLLLEQWLRPRNGNSGMTFYQIQELLEICTTLFNNRLNLILGCYLLMFRRTKFD